MEGVRRAGVDQPAAHRDGRGLGSRRGAELLEDRLHVTLGGLGGDAEPGGDVLVAVAFDEKVQHVGLTTRERAVRKAARDPVRRGTGQEVRAAGHGAHAFDKLAQIRPEEHVAPDSELERRADLHFALARGHDDDLAERFAGPRPRASALQALDAALVVGDHDLRARFARQGLEARGQPFRRGDHLEIVVLPQGRHQAHADDRILVGDQDGAKIGGAHRASPAFHLVVGLQPQSEPPW